LNKKILKSKFCQDLGKNKGCPSCKSWEPNIDNLSEKTKFIISQLVSCDDNDFPILMWILDKQQILAENKLPYRIGDTVYVQVHDNIYSMIIINATLKTITGRDIESGVSFTLTNFSEIYNTKKDLEKTLLERKENKQKKHELEKIKLENIFKDFTIPPPKIRNFEGTDDAG